MARITLIKSTPLRSANRLHSLRPREIVARLRILDDLGRFGFDRAVQDGERILVGIDPSRKNFSTRWRASAVQPAQTRQKVANRGDVFPPRQDALKAVGQQRIAFDFAGGATPSS